MGFHLPERKIRLHGQSVVRRAVPPSGARLHAFGKTAIRAALFTVIFFIGSASAQAAR
jgi:hypothetical protein